MDTELLLISPNIVYPESPISGRAVPVRAMEKVVNLGILSIASYLVERGITVKIMDFVGDENDIEKLRPAIQQGKPRFVGISCISCYGYLKLIEYTELIKEWDESIFILAGGQHILGIPQNTMEEAPHLDCVVQGEGELLCYQIISRVKAGQSLKDLPSIVYREQGKLINNTMRRSEKINLDELAFLNYNLYPNFQEYAPHVEESRGCSFSCNFCTAASEENGIRYKSMARFVDELEYVKSLYGWRDDLKYFFACSNFGLKKTRLEELIQLLKERQLNIAWRTQTRVDTPVVDYLEQLVEVGLSVLDLGLESGSARILELMNKTQNSQKYLAKARHFIKRAGQIENLLIKVNLVLYAGETPDTLRETTFFMLEHSENIDGISVGPVMVYAGTPLSQHLPDHVSQHGTTLVKGSVWDKVHAYQVNPSAHFSYDQLNAFAHILSKMLSPEKQYFEIKKYGQFPLNMDFNEFQQQTHEQAKHRLPFNFDR